MKNPHYLRVVQAFTLAAIVPACSGAAVDETDTTRVADPLAPSLAAAPSPITRPTTPQLATADASVPDADIDAAAPHSSGPIVPPEMA